MESDGERGSRPSPTKRAAEAELQEQAKRHALDVLAAAGVAGGDAEDDEEAEALHAAILEQLQQQVQQQQEQQQGAVHVTDSDEEDGGAGGGAGAGIPGEGKGTSRWLQPKQTSGPRVGKEYQVNLDDLPAPSA